jgi:hypothetical protein
MHGSLVCRLLSRPVTAGALAGLLGPLNLAAEQSRLTVQNETQGIITVVRSFEAWQPGAGAYLPGMSAVRRHLKPGESTSFTYQVAAKVLESQVVIRSLGENGLVHHDGFTIRFLRPGARLPGAGAQALQEGLPAVAEGEVEPDWDEETAAQPVG